MSDNGVKFVGDLPERVHRGGAQPKWRWFFDELRTKSGEWAKFPGQTKNAHSQAANIKAGRMVGATKGEFEATARDGDVYVRHIGDPDG